MNFFFRLAIAINQSFRLIFTSISKGVQTVFHSIKSIIIILSDSIKKLHDLLTKIIQFIINISSIIFIFFIPIIFLFDPLNWSQYFNESIGKSFVSYIRIIVGIFFILVIYFLMSDLIKTWKEALVVNNSNNALKSNFITVISKLLSWAIIFIVFIYFSIFRFELIAKDKLDEFLFPYSSFHFPYSVSHIPLLNSKIEKISFFDYDSKKYSNKFNRKTTRYIKWNMILTHPKAKKKHRFTITYIYYKPNGSIFFESTFKTSIKKGSEKSYYQGDVGYKKSGKWHPGIYKVELFIEDQKIATQFFEIIENKS